jgi:hypothetical protein
MAVTAMATKPFDRGVNSEIIELKGKLMWVRVVELNKYGKWSLDLYPDKDSLELLRRLQAEGIKNVIKLDEEGQYHVQISRPSTVEFQKGNLQSVYPPKIRDKDKQPLPDNIRIGNGSDGVVAVEVYTHRVPNSEKRAKAMRLYGVEVHNLVPFEVTDEGFDVDSEAAQQVW